MFYIKYSNCIAVRWLQTEAKAKLPGHAWTAHILSLKRMSTRRQKSQISTDCMVSYSTLFRLSTVKAPFFPYKKLQENWANQCGVLSKFAFTVNVLPHASNWSHDNISVQYKSGLWLGTTTCWTGTKWWTDVTVGFIMSKQKTKFSNYAIHTCPNVVIPSMLRSGGVCARLKRQ